MPIKAYIEASIGSEQELPVSQFELDSATTILNKNNKWHNYKKKLYKLLFFWKFKKDTRTYYYHHEMIERRTRPTFYNYLSEEQFKYDLNKGKNS